MPTFRRTIKNVVRNYSDAQVKVREATSNDPWGPSSTLMSEVADLTYNVVAFTEIMQMIWKRLNDDGKNWRHVYKSLVLLDYIIKTGSEKVAQQCKENFHAIRTLTSFQYIDADNKDQGMNVREKAKQLVALLSDDERLKNERAKALKAKERFAQNAMGIGSSGERANGRSRLDAASPTLQSGAGGYADPYGGATGYDSSPSSGERRPSTDLENARPSSVGEEELQLQLALAMSKEEHDEEVRRQKSDDIKLQLAIDESRRQAKDDPESGGSSLLDLDPGDASSSSQTTDPWGVPLQRTPAVDPWGVPQPPQPAATFGMETSPKPNPWGSPENQTRQAAPAPVPAADPWGVPATSPAQSTPVTHNDPWNTSSASQASPWGSPAPPAQQPVGFDVFDAKPATNGTTNIDSEFDLLSSRSENTSPLKVNSAAGKTQDGFDPLGRGGAGDAWAMNDVGQALPEENKKKKAEDFLGANAGLVNLDQLVSTDPSKGNNPFATASSTNPFEQPTTRVPMNQLQNTAPGFTQPVSAGLLPTPLIPMSTAQPMQPQNQGYNPFL